MINGIYIGIYFFDQWKNTESLRNKDKELRVKGFEVQLGKSVISVDFENILAFYVDEGATYLKTRALKNYVLDGSLNKVLPRLPEEYFFRINRRFIVHRNLIRGYQKDINGKLRAELYEGYDLPSHLIISRITAPDFKKWFRAAVQPS